MFFKFVLESNIVKLSKELERVLGIQVINAKVLFEGNEDFNYFLNNSKNPRKYRSSAVGYICTRYNDMSDYEDDNIPFGYGTSELTVITNEIESFIHKQFGGGYIESIRKGSKVYTFYLVDDKFVTL